MPDLSADRKRGTSQPSALRQTSPYERLKQAIMAGDLVPGEQLVEISLAEWCQVSRTPIREALTRLDQDGLAQRTERGLVVRENSPEEIIDLYESRITLEGKVAAVAAERRTGMDLSSMRRANERYRRIPLDEVDTLAERNREFHRTIWLASRNHSLIDLLERLNMHLGRHPNTTLEFPGRHESSLREHHELITAIDDRDAECAAKVASEHFTAARDIRLKLWEEE